MKARLLFAATLSTLFVLPVLPAQEGGQWRAASTSAKSITGDVAFSDIKFIINFAGYTMAQIRTLTPAEIAAVFNTQPDEKAVGNLYRTDIPGDKRFAHKNTLCGSEDVQWLATFVHGKTLQLAMFSGNDMPKLTADDLANAPNRCGAYTYVR